LRITDSFSSLLLMKALGLLVLLFAGPSLKAMDASFSCRVKTDVIQAHASLMNNAGCLISRTTDRAEEVLLVRGPEQFGALLAFPGGTPAKKSADEKEKTNRRFAKSVEFDYHEPSVCTAARETKEETGFDVIVGDLLDRSEYFNLFRCQIVAGGRAGIDELEISEVAWHRVASLISRHEAGEKVFRFESNYEILKKLFSK
jgi:8-oxo-dGTP pyrophosphatase MutT (NUDIX family)